nr:F0F1 ATP synthase subunit A [bacterium]
MFLAHAGKKKLAAQPGKKAKRLKMCGSLLAVVGVWLFLTQLVSMLFGPHEGGGFDVQISPERISVLGLSVSSTVIVTWIAMAFILVLALLVRLFVIPRMTDSPKGIQNLLELAVEGISQYAENQGGHMGENLSAYLFSLAIMMVTCAAVELFGIRPPTADLTMTLALALVTFFLINYYGIRRKGVGGRLKSLASPTPIVFPLRVLSDIAVPISMACRLFGNMLGGMVVMDLLYTALGNNALGIPSVAGLYFNVFHPIIQAFIFITLTLAFIREATED